MEKILRKRVRRDLKANVMRYLALFGLIVLGMYLIVAIVGEAENIIAGVRSGENRNNVEDGHFNTFIPLDQSERDSIEAKGVTLEPMFYLDYLNQDGSTVRLYRNRIAINRIDLTVGRMAESSGEILLEKQYAAAHSLTVGDSLMLGGTRFTVTGIGTTPDYDSVLKELTDTSSDGKNFGTAFVSEAQYISMRDEAQAVKSEEYVYSYRLNGQMLSGELKDIIVAVDFDESEVKDKFFREKVDQLRSDQYDLEDGIKELRDGAGELKDGLNELDSHSDDLKEGIEEIQRSYLEEAGESLKELGNEQILTAANYRQIVSEMSSKSGHLSSQMQGAMDGLDAIREYQDAVSAYVGGVSSLSEGSTALKDGTASLKSGAAELAGNNQSLIEGTDQVFAANLAQVSAMLAEYGVAVREDNYRQVLKELIRTATEGGQADLAEQLKSALAGLDNLKAFKDGIRAYTNGVAEVSSGAAELDSGAAELKAGAGDLTGYNEAMRNGAAAIFDAMLGQVAEQLRERGIDRTLTGDNYQAVLSKLSGEAGDAIVREQLASALEGLDSLQEYRDGIREYTDGVKEARDGASELYNGIAELQQKTDEIIDEFFSVDIDNLTGFVEKQNNPRIEASINDVLINKYVGMAAGVIVMILFTFVISVFVIHGIDQETAVIGALYALGVKKPQLIRHYLTLPVFITALGGIAGTALGFTPALAGAFSGDAAAYFSMPELTRTYPVYLFLYGLIMPPLAAVLVNYLVIGKKLSQPALKLLRREPDDNPVRGLNIKRLGYIRTFQLRQFFREMRSGLAVVFGMFVSLLILMLGVNCYYLCTNIVAANKKDAAFEYMYTLKYPRTEVPAEAEEGYVESMYRKAYGYDIEVTLMGLKEGSGYFAVTPPQAKNKVVISDAAASKFKLGRGDMLVLEDPVREQHYAFEVADIVPYSIGIHVFMDIEKMRELFAQDKDYYNVLFADRELPLEAGRLYGIITRKDIEKSAGIFLENMAVMIYTMIGAAIVIFVIVMYLMMKVMIDRSAFHISLMKVFGYRRREIKKLYLDGNILLIASAAVLCIPAAKMLMDLMYPYLVSNVAIGMDLEIGWFTYLIIYAGTVGCSMLNNRLLVHRLNKIRPAEILKDRE